MKRSEALKEIEKYWKTWEEDECHPTPEQIASITLNLVEKGIGMLPPLNEDVYDHMDNQDRYCANLGAKLHIWEDEDEEE